MKLFTLTGIIIMVLIFPIQVHAEEASQLDISISSSNGQALDYLKDNSTASTVALIGGE